MFESHYLIKALKSSRDKIVVFLTFIMIVVTIFGSVMYFVEGTLEGGNPNFDSIPRGVYWAIVTLTTVGYGDISPHTWLGQGLAAVIMIMGYAIIAVPTGIITSEFSRAYKKRYNKETISTQVCSACMKEGHSTDAVYCKFCANELHPLQEKNAS